MPRSGALPSDLSGEISRSIHEHQALLLAPPGPFRICAPHGAATRGGGASRPHDQPDRLADGRAGTPTYRWLVQLDTTFDHQPGALAMPHKNLPTDNGYTPHAGESLSVSFHASYAPVVAAGDSTDTEVTALRLDPTKRYFVSVMPYLDQNYNMSGAPVVHGHGRASATVALSPLPFRPPRCRFSSSRTGTPSTTSPRSPRSAALRASRFRSTTTPPERSGSRAVSSRRTRTATSWGRRTVPIRAARSPLASSRKGPASS